MKKFSKTVLDQRLNMTFALSFWEKKHVKPCKGIKELLHSIRFC